MTFLELQNEAILLRFTEKTGTRTSVKAWLNLAYGRIWDHADWTFKTVTAATLAVTAGDATPVMPPELGKVLDLYDDSGEPISYLPRRRWEELYLPTASAASPSYHYTVVNRQIHLGPAPSGAANYKLSYRRRLAHVDSVSGVIGGIMVEDADQPLWGAEHDYLLILEALIIGMQLEQDPGWRDLVPQRDELLASMVRADVGDVVREHGRQWGGR